MNCSFPGNHPESKTYHHLQFFLFFPFTYHVQTTTEITTENKINKQKTTLSKSAIIKITKPEANIREKITKTKWKAKYMNTKSNNKVRKGMVMDGIWIVLHHGWTLLRCDSYKATRVSPLVLLTWDPEGVAATCFFDATPHLLLSFRSSCFICFSRHSELQKALSPLQFSFSSFQLIYNHKNFIHSNRTEEKLPTCTCRCHEQELNGVCRESKHAKTQGCVRNLPNAFYGFWVKLRPKPCSDLSRSTQLAVGASSMGPAQVLPWRGCSEHPRPRLCWDRRLSLTCW